MASEDTVEYRLSQLFRLKERGFISDAEFEAGRLRLVERLLQGETEIPPEPALAEPAPLPVPELPSAPPPVAGVWWRRVTLTSAIVTVGLFLSLAGILGAQVLSGDDGEASLDPIVGDVRVALVDGASGAIAPSTAQGQRTEVTAMRVIDPADPRDPDDNPEPGNRFWVAEVFIQASGSESSFAPTWTLATADGGEYTRSLDTGLGADALPAGSLAPGGQSIGLVVFEIPLAAQPVWLRADPDPSGENDLYFDIAAGQ